MSKKNEKYSTEELAFGRVYQKLRSAKGFSQKEAAGTEISVSHLSNFENGKTIVSTHHFFKLLQNINVNMFEFQNAYNQHLKKEDLLLFSEDLSNALVEQDDSKLRYIASELEHRLQTDSSRSINKKLRLDYIRVKSALSHIGSNYSITETELEFLLDYLYNITEWGEYDIALLGQCAQFLKPFNLKQLTDKMTSPTQININVPYIKHTIIQTVLNIINVFVEVGWFDEARKKIKYLEESHIHDYYMFEKLTLIYNTANCNYKEGDKTALEVMKQCQKALEFCHCFKTANWVASDISKLEE